MPMSLAPITRRLAGQRGHPCVTLTVPLDRGTAQPDTANRQLDHELSVLRSTLLRDWGLATREIEPILGHLTVGPDDVEGRAEGLAVFVTPSGVTRVPLAHRPRLRVVAAEEPDLLALVADFDRPSPFHLLALTQERARLWRCDVLGWSPAEVSLPTREEALAHFDEQPGTDVGGARAGGQMATTHHGGTVTDFKKERTRLYFQQLAGRVGELLSEGRDLLVVASVPHETAMFRTALSQSQVLELDVGNPDDVPVADLHAKALDAVRASSPSAAGAAADRFVELAGTGRTEDDFYAVDAAASEGRVETLLVRADVLADEELATRVRHTVGSVFAHGGEGFVVDADRLANGPLAAILRY